MKGELALLPEVAARKLLCERDLRLEVLAPHGAWIGSGVLRVLAVKAEGERGACLTVGYESYHPA